MSAQCWFRHITSINPFDKLEVLIRKNNFLMDLLNYFQMTSNAKCPRGAQTTAKSSEYEDIYHMYNNITGKYHCPRCSKTYGSKSGLSQHYQMHLGKFSYWCDLCYKGFPVKCNYDAHMAKHEGRTFPCDSCNKRFKSKRGLQIHYVEHQQN